ITNTAGSPLAQACEYPLLLQAGPEATVSCKTYVSTILALRWLGALLVGRDEAQVLQEIQPAGVETGRYLAGLREHVALLAGQLRGTRYVFLVGRGDSLAAVGTGSLILKESAHCHAEGMSSAAFRHGPLEMISDSMRSFVFAGDPRTLALNRQLLRDLMAAGA